MEQSRLSEVYCGKQYSPDWIERMEAGLFLIRESGEFTRIQN